MEREPGYGDYERFPFENVLGVPRYEDYLKMPCQNDRCGNNDTNEDSGCKELGKHSVSTCSLYQPEIVFEKLNVLEREIERLTEENKRIRRIVKTWAEAWRAIL